MDELVAWLREQLDDDERVARAVPHEHWSLVGPPGSAPTLCGTSRSGSFTSHAHLAEPVAFHDPMAATLTHAARWDPARVLALTEALRASLDAFSWEGQETRIIRVLAEALYVDRPGYREEWR